MKKTIKKLSLTADTIRTLASAQLERVAGGESAFCQTQDDPCGPGSLGVVNGCCSTKHTKAYTCATQC